VWWEEEEASAQRVIRWGVDPSMLRNARRGGEVKRDVGLETVVSEETVVGVMWGREWQWKEVV